MTTAAPPSIPLIPSVSALAERYDVWLCDVWGVIHNGERAYAGAVEACRRFRARGGTVVLVSNAPRPAANVVPQLERLGVAEDARDSLVTSGDVTRNLLEANKETPLFHLGPERDKGLFEGLSLNFVAPGAAGLVICTGLYDDTTETPDDYADLLGELAARELTMICANPDLKVERGAQLVYCAGALAARYEEIGGRVTYAGKPHPPIYERSFVVASELRGAPVPRELRKSFDPSGNVTSRPLAALEPLR
jgi:HAD superfamily hydrolase (TIGR01459 family)